MLKYFDNVQKTLHYKVLTFCMMPERNRGRHLNMILVLSLLVFTKNGILVYFVLLYFFSTWGFGLGQSQSMQAQFFQIFYYLPFVRRMLWDSKMLIFYRKCKDAFDVEH